MASQAAGIAFVCAVVAILYILLLVVLFRNNPTGRTRHPNRLPPRYFVDADGVPRDMNEPRLITLTQGMTYTADGLRRQLREHAGFDDNVDLSRWRVFRVPRAWVEEAKPFRPGKRLEERGLVDPDDFVVEPEMGRFW
jgi:hypothetical protein